MSAWKAVGLAIAMWLALSTLLSLIVDVRGCYYARSPEDLWVEAAPVAAANAENPPIPGPAECQLLATAGEVDVYRCSGVGFFGWCYLAVPRTGMSRTPAMECS